MVFFTKPLKSQNNKENNKKWMFADKKLPHFNGVTQAVGTKPAVVDMQRVTGASSHRVHSESVGQPFHLVEPSYFPIKAAITLLLTGNEVVRLLRGPSMADIIKGVQSPFPQWCALARWVEQPTNYEFGVVQQMLETIIFRIFGCVDRADFLEACIRKFAFIVRLLNDGQGDYFTVFRSFLTVCRTMDMFPVMFTRVAAVYFFAITVKAWFSKASSEENSGHHTLEVQNSFRIGIVLFIASEIMLFAGFFWAFFHAGLSPNSGVGYAYPPEGVSPFAWWRIPMLNTAILLSSGLSVTIAHARMLQNLSALRSRFVTAPEFISPFSRNKTVVYTSKEELRNAPLTQINKKVSFMDTNLETSAVRWVTYDKVHFAGGNVKVPSGYFWLLDTVARGFVFMLLQAFEYMSSLFTISDSVYGGVFYILTGLHGVHVAIGAIMLLISYRWGFRYTFESQQMVFVTNEPEFDSWRTRSLKDFYVFNVVNHAADPVKPTKEECKEAALDYLNSLFEGFKTYDTNDGGFSPKVKFIIDTTDGTDVTEITANFAKDDVSFNSYLELLSSYGLGTVGHGRNIYYGPRRRFMYSISKDALRHSIRMFGRPPESPAELKAIQAQRDAAYYYHLIGVEGAIWYWHFVDVVWLFVFLFVYCWSYPPVM